MRIKIITVLSTLLISGSANAWSWKDLFTTPPIKNWFVELSAERSKYGYDTYDYYFHPDWNSAPGTTKHINNALSFNIGKRYNNNFGQQVSLTYAQDVNFKFSNGSTKQHLSNVFMDGLYFIPIRDAFEAKLLYGVGLFTIDYDTKTSSDIYSFTQRGLYMGIRGGVGLQYNFNKRYAADFMYKYQAPFNKVKYISGFSVGVIYNFAYM